MQLGRRLAWTLRPLPVGAQLVVKACIGVFVSLVKLGLHYSLLGKLLLLTLEELHCIDLLLRLLI